MLTYEQALRDLQSYSDKIFRLEAELADERDKSAGYEYALKQFDERVAGLTDELAAVIKTRDKAYGLWLQGKAELAAERERVTKLREALEPFEKAAETCKRSLGTTPDDQVYGVYVGDLRRAQAALKKT